MGHSFISAHSVLLCHTHTYAHKHCNDMQRGQFETNTSWLEPGGITRNQKPGSHHLFPLTLPSLIPSHFLFNIATCHRPKKKFNKYINAQITWTLNLPFTAFVRTVRAYHMMRAERSCQSCWCYYGRMLRKWILCGLTSGKNAICLSLS